MCGAPRLRLCPLLAVAVLLSLRRRCAMVFVRARCFREIVGRCRALIGDMSDTCALREIRTSESRAENLENQPRGLCMLATVLYVWWQSLETTHDQRKIIAPEASSMS